MPRPWRNGPGETAGASIARRTFARRPLARRIVGAVAFASLVALTLDLPPASTSSMPESVTFAGTSTVGALFSYANGKLGAHYCSGSVIDSPAGDLVLTAAHCVSGRTPSAIAFVPDWDKGSAPYGVWAGTASYVDRAWQSGANPDDDFAFLAVSRPGSKANLQSVTGAEQIATDRSPIQLLRVIGYPETSNAPITCENVGRSFSTTQIEFDCGGYADGTSGGPMLLATSKGSEVTVIGVIGGYQLGGDSPSISYAAKFATQLSALYRVATS